MYRWVPTALRLLSRIAPVSAGFLQSEGRVGADGHAAEFASDPIEVDPGFSAAVTDSQRQPRIALVEYFDLA